MTRLIISLIHVYRWIISPLFPPRCRFEPTCSRYAIHALETHGLSKGLWLVIKRLLRCHPYEKLTKQLGVAFGYDPVPDMSKKVSKSRAKLNIKSTTK
ncbi:MAG: membrane protein insertion efficiency factor YidD [Candidatus Paracaedibacteraceae bacterium]|nr:membrane protein insertion efficiency factor YidD [Candidatus Paracaedibacteraceae bacterium]